MPNTIDKFENFKNAHRHFRQNKITDDAEKYAWFQKEYATVQLSMEALRAYFQNLIPGQDITVADDQVEHRAAVSEQARHEYILIGVEHSTIPLHESVSRHLSMLFRPEVDEASRNYNAKFAQAIDNKDVATIAGLMTDGCNMGVKSLNRYLNQYKAADEVSKDITKRLIHLEQRLIHQSSGYL